jgi:hypothetical protein
MPKLLGLLSFFLWLRMWHGTLRRSPLPARSTDAAATSSGG